ncbi:carboxymuconolactone decarboxylase [Microbacterium mangrovi]|uniref:Carboxymuconolactone decarboxylase n=2 Tax=Microbacterium mangrovi TaxID=1348253 RepID=A0A0B1ZV62_9MICO|nr:carboxymuconolactone decarboxylase [Microbacterium mangrovi]
MDIQTTAPARIPAAPVTGILGALLKMGAKKMVGRVPDSIGVLWQHKGVMKDSMAIGRKVDGWHELDRNLASYAAMASAATIGCSFCLDYNYFEGKNHGLDTAKIREVPRWRESAVFTPLERDVMEYAEAASQTPPAVTDELSGRLLDQIGAPALVELAARVAFMNMTARMNVALGIRSEHFADSCGLPPLATRSAVGGA